MLQLGTLSGDQYVIDCRDNDIRQFRPLLENPNILFVGHNIKFDYNMLKQYDIILNKVYDTMIADQCLHNGKYNIQQIIKFKRFSLAGVYMFYFKKKIEKDTRDEFLILQDRSFSEKQILYGSNDVVYPLQIKDEQDNLATMYNLHDYIRLENKVLLSLADAEYNGIMVDQSQWRELLKTYALNVKKTLVDLDNFLLEQPDGAKYRVQAKQLTMFDVETLDRLSTINWSSNVEVMKILKEVFYINPIDKHGKKSTGANALDILDPFKGNKIVQLILKHRKEEKMLTTFGQKYLDKYIDFDGRIRTTLNQIVTTGRVSSRNPNMQQIPHDKIHRKCFISSPGYTFCISDYSQQESRIMADFAKDSSMMNFFKTGDGDLHSFVATKVFSTKFKKDFIVSQTENTEYRQLGKTLNFAISYGASAYGIAVSNGLKQEEAQELIDLFYSSFPTLKELFQKAKTFGLENGYIITNPLVKTRRWFPEWVEYKKLLNKKNSSKEEYRELSKIKGSIERRSQNSIIQGSAAIMTKLALILIRDRLIQDGIRPTKGAIAKIILPIHDEIILEVKDGLEDKYSEVLKTCMERAGTFICKRVDIIAAPLHSKFWVH